MIQRALKLRYTSHTDRNQRDDVYRQQCQELEPLPIPEWLAFSSGEPCNLVDTSQVVTDGKAEHWLNGKKQVEYVNKGAEWDAMIAQSKFKNFDAFGQTTSGKISLQDHGDAVWYRNIRIRELSK